MTAVLYAEFTAKAGSESTVAELIAGLTVLVRREPGNLLFTPYTREDNPRHYVVFEAYADADAFQSHISAEYGMRFNRELAPHIEEAGSVLTWLVPFAVPDF
jgi:quinol monooxygenase YgiN